MYVGSKGTPGRMSFTTLSPTAANNNNKTQHNEFQTGNDKYRWVRFWMTHLAVWF